MACFSSPTCAVIARNPIRHGDSTPPTTGKSTTAREDFLERQPSLIFLEITDFPLDLGQGGVAERFTYKYFTLHQTKNKLKKNRSTGDSLEHIFIPGIIFYSYLAVATLLIPP